MKQGTWLLPMLVIVGACEGAQGPAGPAGAEGAPGSEGPPGKDGPVGKDGPSFDAGAPSTTCATLLAGGDTTDGLKTIQIKGVDTQVYCDQTSAGGGWTIVYAATGAAAEDPITSDTAVAGNPLEFAAYNVGRALKVAISELSSESLFLRESSATAGAKGPLIIVNHAMFDEQLLDPNGQNTYFPVTVRDGETPPTYTSSVSMGWSRFHISGGGDFGITSRNVSFDHHSTNYWMLRASCIGQLLYSYNSLDGDVEKAGYDVNTALGSWTVTSECQSTAGGTMKFYAAMR